MKKRQDDFYERYKVNFKNMYVDKAMVKMKVKVMEVYNKEIIKCCYEKEVKKELNNYVDKGYKEKTLVEREGLVWSMKTWRGVSPLQAFK